MTGGLNNTTGQPVNDKTALSLSPVHACVRVIADGLSTMPLKVISNVNGSKEVDTTSAAARLIDEPNPFMTGVSFRKYMTSVAVLKGNSFAYIFRDGAGNPVNLLPLQNCSVVVKIGNGQVFYEISTTDKIYEGIPKLVPATEILHFKGLNVADMFMGINPIQYHAQTFGIDLAAMTAIGNTFKTGTKKYMLTADKPWNTEQQKFTRDSMESVLSNDRLVFTVPTGVAAETISMTPAEAGYLEAIGATAKDIARIFGVPASIIGADDGAIKSTVEQDALNFLNQTLNPWAVNIEAELNRKLLAERDKGTKKHKFNFNSLLRADAATRAQFYSTMLNIGAMNANEIRSYEDMNGYDFGDTYLQPANLVPADQMKDWIQAKIDSMDKQTNPNGNN